MQQQKQITVYTEKERAVFRQKRLAVKRVVEDFAALETAGMQAVAAATILQLLIDRRETRQFAGSVMKAQMLEHYRLPD